MQQIEILMTTEKRHYHRVAFKNDAILTGKDLQINCQVIDISIQGVLLAVSDRHSVPSDSQFELQIPLDQGQESINMKLKLKNQRGNQIGLACYHIDLDSISHLRRLIELNLGDSTILERDFESLVKEGFE